MWSNSPRRIATGLWMKSRSSGTIRLTFGSRRRRRRQRPWEESSAFLTSSSFHPTTFPTNPAPGMVSFRRAFGVPLPEEERIETNEFILEESVADSTHTEHDLLLQHKQPSHDDDLMSLVEEILSFQDEIGNAIVRYRWTREYGFLKRQLGLLGRKSDYGDDTWKHTEDDDISVPTTMELSARIEEDLDKEEQYQLVDLPYFERKPLDQSTIDESIPSDESRSRNVIIKSDTKGEEKNASEVGVAAQHLDDRLASVDDDEEEPNDENNAVTDKSAPFLNNLVEREETEDAYYQESSFKDSFARALALLRSMSKAEWNAYDLLDEENDEDVDSNDENEQDEEVHKPTVKDEDSPHNYNDDYRIEDSDENREMQNPEFADEIAAKAVSKTTLTEHSNKDGDGILSTEESNELLVRLALSSNLEAEMILRRMMEEYQRMLRLENLGFGASAPNQISHEILLLTLCRRLGAIGTAVDLIKQMIEKEERWVPDTLLVATQILEQRRNLILSMQLLSASFQDITRKNKIPSRVFHSILRLAKQDNAKDEALAILKMCMKESVHRHDRKVDKVVIDAIYWQTRNRRGQKMDTTDFLKDLTDLIEQRRLYIPGTIVWKHLILVASEGALENEERCELVRRAFQKLLSYRGNNNLHNNWLTRNIFHQGVVVAEALGDTKLVADVTTRFLQQHAIWSSRISDQQMTPSLPVKDIIQAMELCIQLDDHPRARSILRSCTLLFENDRIPKQIVESLYLLGLKGYAAKGEPASAIDLLNEMKLKSLHVSEQAYGTVIHGYAIAGKHAEAKNFFASIMETAAAATTSGEMRVIPGATCYDGLILSCVRARSWQEALAIFQMAKEKKLALHASTSHAVIMSASRLASGGTTATTTATTTTTTTSQKVKSVIQDILETDSDINKETCILALHVLIPELGIKLGTATSLDDIRHRLRDIVGTTASSSSSSSLSRESALKLISCLRTAELEDERCRLRKDISSFSSSSSSSSSARPHRAWATALASIVESAK